MIYAFNSAYPDGLWLATALVAVAAAFGYLWLVGRRASTEQPAWVRTVLILFTQPLVGMGFAMLALAWIAWVNIPPWLTTRAALSTGQVVLVEGTVSLAASKRVAGGLGNTRGSTRESFKVAGRTFSYQSGEKGPYPLLVENGGALKNGDRVRIAVSKDEHETVLRVELVR